MPRYTRDELQKKINDARSRGVSQEAINARVAQLESAGDIIDSEKKSVGGFVQNAGEDLVRNVSGVAALPSVAMTAIKNPTSVPQMAGDVVKGTLQEYIDLVKNPVDTTYEKPITTLLNLMPVVGRAGKVAKSLDAAGDAAKTADKLSDATQARILKNPGGAEDLTKVNRVSKSVYQSTLPFSKKGNSFERLMPSKTANDLVRYGVGGSNDDIAKTASKITGKEGIFSRIVNESVSAADDPIDISPIQSVLNKDELTGRFSEISTKEINDLKKMVNSSVGGGMPNQALPSKLLDLERKLQEQAFSHVIQGRKGDTKAAEFGQLKFEIADAIGQSLDAVAEQKMPIDRFKTPEILAAVEKISPELASDFKNAKTVSDVRSLQAPFVRAKKIVELADQEASSLGNNFFSFVRNIPGVGPGVDALAEELITPAVRSGANALENTAVGRGLQKTGTAVSTAAKNPKDTAFGLSLAEDLLPEQNPSELPDSPDKVNFNGGEMVTIRNNETGETKQISRSELPKYVGGQDSLLSKDDLRMMAQIDMVKTGGKNLTKIIQLSEFLGEGQDPVEQAGVSMVSEVERLVDNLNLPESEEEARSQKTVRLWSARLGGDQNLRLYRDIKRGLALQLAVKMQGSSQGLSDKDVEAAENLLPDVGDTRSSAKEKIEIVKRILTSGSEVPSDPSMMFIDE